MNLIVLEKLVRIEVFFENMVKKRTCGASREHVPVPYGGHSDDGPPKSGGDAHELGLRLLLL